MNGDEVGLTRSIIDTGAQSVVVYARQSVPVTKFYAFTESNSASGTSFLLFCIDAEVAVPQLSYLRTAVLLPIDHEVVRQMLLGNAKYTRQTLAESMLKHPLLVGMAGNQKLLDWAQSGQPASQEITAWLSGHGVVQSFDALEIDCLLGMSYLGRINLQYSAAGGRSHFRPNRSSIALALKHE